MPTNEADCPFCRIARGDDRAAEIVYSDDDIVGFPPPDPATLGHVLLVPRVHVEDIWSLPERLAEALARATLHIADAVREAVEPEGLNIIQSNGQAATQTVPHLHVHVVPRWATDDVHDPWPRATHFSAAAKRNTASRIREALSSRSSEHAGPS